MNDQTSTATETNEPVFVRFARAWDRLSIGERYELLQIADDINAEGSLVAIIRWRRRLRRDTMHVEAASSDDATESENVVISRRDLDRLQDAAAIPTIEKITKFRAADRLWAVKTIDRHDGVSEWSEVTITGASVYRNFTNYGGPEWNAAPFDASDVSRGDSRVVSNDSSPERAYYKKASDDVPRANDS